VGQDRRAFTLIELVVVMGVLALAAVLIVPSFTRFRQGIQLQEAARQTLAFATEARGLARARDTTVTLTYDEGAHGLRLEVAPGDAEQEPGGKGPDAGPLHEHQAPDTRLLEYPLEVAVSLESREGRSERSVRFYGDGRADPVQVRFEREGFDPVVLEMRPRTGRLTVVEGGK
jgi:prepilin-type N-terminal cleavage/methylation domain-containing protein